MKLPFFKAKAGLGDFGRPEPSFNLERTKIRLAGLGSYATISTLLLNAALRLLSSTPKKLDGRKQEDAAKILFGCLISATVIFGSYTTMVFTLLTLYSNAALGMGLDEEFVEFFAATHEIRRTGFASFVATILSFNFAFVLSLYLTYEGPVRFWITSISCVVIAISVQNWYLVVQYASIIYSR
jgi:hypothetical protein